jgi:HPt (histidine-containing phosphotransfer) domain-containing protein
MDFETESSLMKSVIDKTVWEELREFERAEGSEGFFRELLATVLTSATTHMENLLAASVANDVNKTRYHSHSLKSTCASLGARGLSAQFADIEAGCRATPPVIDAAKIASASSVFQQFYREVQEEHARLEKQAA